MFFELFFQQFSIVTIGHVGMTSYRKDCSFGGGTLLGVYRYA